MSIYALKRVYVYKDRIADRIAFPDQFLRDTVSLTSSKLTFLNKTLVCRFTAGFIERPMTSAVKRSSSRLFKVVLVSFLVADTPRLCSIEPSGLFCIDVMHRRHHEYGGMLDGVRWQVYPGWCTVGVMWGVSCGYPV